MEQLSQYARSPYGVALIWCGSAVLVAAATKPVWSPLLFGYEPTLEDLLDLALLRVLTKGALRPELQE